jgi:ribosomal protein L27
VGGSLKAGMSAVVIVYEQRWTRHLASAVVQAGGDVTLHAQLPHDTVTAAVT